VQTTVDTSREEQFVVFSLANESFGVDIARVQEIRRVPEVTHVPRAPEFVQGVMNLRGTVIPVVDLRLRFGLPPGERTRASRVVVLEAGSQAVGVLVDAVSEVIRIGASAIEPPSSVIAGDGEGFVRGIAKVDERLILVLDLDRVLGRVLGDLDAVNPSTVEARAAS
jgi:purine-binding chemotaxis protein CheW